MRQTTNFSVRILAIAAVLFISICTFAQETASVVRYNKNTQAKETLCLVKYWVSGNKFYVDTPFSYLGIIFSDNAGAYKAEKSLVLKKDNSGNYFTTLSNSSFNNISGYHITGIVIRNCKLSSIKDRQCYDAYLYNNVKEIPSWRGTSSLNTTTEKIINQLK